MNIIRNPGLSDDEQKRFIQINSSSYRSEEFFINVSPRQKA